MDKKELKRELLKHSEREDKPEKIQLLEGCKNVCGDAKEKCMNMCKDFVNEVSKRNTYTRVESPIGGKVEIGSEKEGISYLLVIGGIILIVIMVFFSFKYIL